MCMTRGGRRPSRRTARGEAGFTLIEITVATALFGVLVFTLAEFYPFAALNGQLGRSLSFATRLAQLQMEEIRTKTFDYINNNSPNNSTEPECTVNTQYSQATVTFTVTSVCVPCINDSTGPCLNSANLIKATVTVTWVEAATQSRRSITLFTLRHNVF